MKVLCYDRLVPFLCVSKLRQNEIVELITTALSDSESHCDICVKVFRSSLLKSNPFASLCLLSFVHHT